MIYGWRYPESIHRSVMIGVNPPGHYVWDAKTTDEQIRRYGDLCSKDEACRARTDDLAASMRRTAADMPDHWFFLPIKEGNVRAASFWGLMETTSENAPLSAPMTLSSWLSAEDGDASGFWFVSLLADFAFPGALGAWGDYAAVARTDARTANDYFSAPRPDSILDDPGAEFLWAGGRLTDAWPAAPDEAEYDRVRTSDVETLLIGGTLDLATPPQWATEELLPHLPNGRQVVLPEFGHTTSFWEDQPEAGTRLINAFFDSGRVDDSLYKPTKVDFTPEVTQTALAKGVAGSMVGLAVITVLSLLWMAVRRTPRFGRKKSVLMRSLYPIVLGLGGWFAGVLIVITIFPGTPLDDQWLATLSVGLPVALGIYYAWLNRDWPARTRLTGFVAAVVAGLVGAWLGFHAGADLLALVTAIVGAVAGANLMLIALDISSARLVRDRFPATTSSPAPSGSGA
jgi:hypothetical protein